MKTLAFALIFLHLADFGAAQCVAGWEDKGGQCMKCSSTIGGAVDTDAATAQGVCVTNKGNLATVINADQETFAFSCGTAADDPWFGYRAKPTQTFMDGTPFVNYGVTPPAAVAADGDCWLLDAVGTWDEQTTGCAGPKPFACSRSYESCYDLEVSGMTSVTYSHVDTSTPVDGSKWVGTTATYSCATGYTVSGTSTRTCDSDGSWTDSEPTCVAAAVCPALTASSDSSVSYSTVISGSSYTTGTIATLSCDSDYDIESGSTTRLCQSSGMWTGSDLECEKHESDALAIGLGVGLGVPVVLGLAALALWICCRRPSAMPRPGPMGPPPPGPVGYPRPMGRRPYPRRMGPRPAY